MGRFFASAVTLILISVFAMAQNYDYGARGPVVGPDRTNLAHVAGVNAGLRIEVLDERRNAQDKKIVVRANLTGVQLIEPNSKGEIVQYEGYLQYRLDGSSPVETTELQHEFANLTSGEHTVEVSLVTREGAPIVKPRILTVHIP